MKNKIYNLRFRAINLDIFEAIKKGRKKVETRAATVKYRDIKAGDTLRFICGTRKFEKKIIKANIFKTIAAMLREYKAEEINPKVNSDEELREIYYSFPGYKEKIKKYGLIALELK